MYLWLDNGQKWSWSEVDLTSGRANNSSKRTVTSSNLASVDYIRRTRRSRASCHLKGPLFDDKKRTGHTVHHQQMVKLLAAQLAEVN